jgi:hypothetical protein
VPRIPDQRSGIRSRLAQLADLPGWPAAAGAVPGPPDQAVEDRLAGIVAAAVRLHTTHGYGNPVLLVHAATAPLAVLRTLPELPTALHGPSLEAAWAATAAVTAAYAPPIAREFAGGTHDAGSVLQRATDSGDAHAIKFADAALEMWARDPDPLLLAAARHATDLIEDE